MSSKTLLCILLGLAAVTSVNAQIDFTPTIREYSAGGFTHRQLSFKSEKGTVVLSLPNKWSFSGDKNRLRMSPPEKSFVEVSIQSLVTPTPLNFDEATIATLEQQVLREAPAGAQSVRIATRAANTVVM